MRYRLLSSFLGEDILIVGYDTIMTLIGFVSTTMIRSFGLVIKVCARNLTGSGKVCLNLRNEGRKIS